MNCSGRFGGCSLSLSLKEASALGIFLVVALLGWYLVGIVKAVFLDCFLSSWTQTNSTNDCIHMYVCLAWVYVCAWLACVYESTSIDNVYIRRKSEREQEKRDFLWVRVCMCELLDVVCVCGGSGCVYVHKPESTTTNIQRTESSRWIEAKTATVNSQQGRMEHFWGWCCVPL